MPTETDKAVVRSVYEAINVREDRKKRTEIAAEKPAERRSREHG